MDVCIYVGGHRASAQHFYGALSQNIDTLNDEGILYSKGTRRTLSHLSNAVTALKDGQNKRQVQADLLQRIMPHQDATRLIITDMRFIGADSRALSDDLTDFYAQLGVLFDNHSLRLFVEARNPTSFIPAAYSEAIFSDESKSFQEFQDAYKTDGFKWSQFITSLQAHNVDVPTLAWRYETYFDRSRELLELFTGSSCFRTYQADAKTNPSGLSFMGAQFLYRYTKEHSDAAREIFLKHFPSDPKEDVGFYWQPEQAVSLERQYQKDWQDIERMKNVFTLES